ncbi:uncharacterized protein LOC124944500 isoform X2 [Impatiens glandulifera]|uniref:uncharacterized protein LOC124944500 isoform X2 n=1 Tax=Impatiens glandulifera TaxID=253017 RepID=UPI001FB069D0|nr:uncharacterized protein LOC124944500 isoform X2 [Impatiens glandulifera]
MISISFKTLLTRLNPNESHSQEKTEAKVQDNELKHKGEQNGDTEMVTPTLKRRRSASPSDNRGALMEQFVISSSYVEYQLSANLVALISSLVGPHITASTASAAITALCHEIQCPNEIFDGDDSGDHVLGSSPEDILEREHRDEGTEAGGGLGELDKKNPTLVSPLECRMLVLNSIAQSQCLCYVFSVDFRDLIDWRKLELVVMYCLFILLPLAYGVVNILKKKDGSNNVNSPLSGNRGQRASSGGGGGSRRLSVSKDTDEFVAYTVHIPPTPGRGTTSEFQNSLLESRKSAAGGPHIGSYVKDTLYTGGFNSVTIGIDL